MERLGIIRLRRTLRNGGCRCGAPCRCTPCGSSRSGIGPSSTLHCGYVSTSLGRLHYYLLQGVLVNIPKSNHPRWPLGRQHLEPRITKQLFWRPRVPERRACEEVVFVDTCALQRGKQRVAEERKGAGVHPGNPVLA